MYYPSVKTVQSRLNPWLINSLAWDSPCASKAWQCITSERAGAFSVPLPNWSTAVPWQPACRMRNTLWHLYCITHRSPVTCQGPSPGGGGSKGWPPLMTGLSGGSSVFSSLNTANLPPCLPSVTNAPLQQVPYSSLFNANKPHNAKITMRLLHSMNIQMPMF